MLILQGQRLKVKLQEGRARGLERLLLNRFLLRHRFQLLALKPEKATAMGDLFLQGE